MVDNVAQMMFYSQSQDISCTQPNHPTIPTLHSLCILYSYPQCEINVANHSLVFLFTDKTDEMLELGQYIGVFRNIFAWKFKKLPEIIIISRVNISLELAGLAGSLYEF